MATTTATPQVAVEDMGATTTTTMLGHQTTTAQAEAEASSSRALEWRTSEQSHDLVQGVPRGHQEQAGTRRCVQRPLPPNCSLRRTFFRGADEGGVRLAARARKEEGRGWRQSARSQYARDE